MEESVEIEKCIGINVSKLIGKINGLSFVVKVQKEQIERQKKYILKLKKKNLKLVQ